MHLQAGDRLKIIGQKTIHPRVTVRRPGVGTFVFLAQDINTHLGETSALTCSCGIVVGTELIEEYDEFADNVTHKRSAHTAAFLNFKLRPPLQQPSAFRRKREPSPVVWSE